MRSIYKFWIKRICLIIIFIFIAYLFYLNNQVKSQFSVEIKAPKNITQINYSLNDYPRELINMLLLVEDQSYFHHHGVDFKEIARVIYGYLFDDKALRGASTITQQLIKNSLLSREKTFSRKSEEALMALILELTYDKEFILERYMNTVYLAQKGDMAYHGFASGSYFYFDKDIKDLSLKDMATLVALLKGPSYYNPVNYPDRLDRRIKMILMMHKNYKIIF
jgi:membrane peptidoglycan carboxypeptidase